MTNGRWARSASTLALAITSLLLLSAGASAAPTFSVQAETLTATVRTDGTTGQSVAKYGYPAYGTARAFWKNGSAYGRFYVQAAGWYAIKPSAYSHVCKLGNGTTTGSFFRRGSLNGYIDGQALPISTAVWGAYKYGYGTVTRVYNYNTALWEWKYTAAPLTTSYYNEYNFATADSYGRYLTAGYHTLKVYFGSDYFSGTCDINVFLDQVNFYRFA